MHRIIFSFLFLLASSFPALAYTSVTCPTPSENDLVIIVAGQSNAGSYGDVAYQGSGATDIQIYFGNSLCYPLYDALAGFPSPPVNPAGYPPMPTPGGSIWTRFAKLYHDANPSWTGKVIIVDIAQNGVPIGNWRNGGPNYPNIATAVSVLASKGWAVDAFFFMDGESDAMAPYSFTQVSTWLDSMVDGRRAAGDAYPFFIGVNSTCRAVPDASKFNGLNPAGTDFQTLANPATRDYAAVAQRMYQQSEVQRAIFSVEDASKGLYIGANTDLISGASRWDGCHMADYGQWVAARLWVDVTTRGQAAGIIP